jgi:SAM-dependent methyltransferase
MDERTRLKLLAINREFYEREAEAFSATREDPWPGWVRVVEGVAAEPISVLDVGCGNGRLARFLERTRAARYVGVDTSPALIAIARARTRADGIRFELCDALASPPGPFDLVAVFGLMHHVPGFERRVGLLASLAGRLAPDGRLAATFWRFGADPRFASRSRGHPRDGDASVDAGELERGDHLLAWGELAPGQSEGPVRYCHFSDEAELERVAACLREADLELVDSFRSDGRSGELNDYRVWQKR